DFVCYHGGVPSQTIGPTPGGGTITVDPLCARLPSVACAGTTLDPVSFQTPPVAPVPLTPPLAASANESNVHASALPGGSLQQVTIAPTLPVVGKQAVTACPCPVP